MIKPPVPSAPFHVCLSSSPTSHYPMMMLPNGQAVPVLPGPVQMPSVINVRHNNSLNGWYYSLVVYEIVSVVNVRVCVRVLFALQLARPMCMVPNIPGIPGPPLGGSSSGSNSPSGYSIHSEAKMVSTSLSLSLWISIFVSLSVLFFLSPHFPSSLFLP